MVGGSDVPTSSATSSSSDGGAVIISKPTRGNGRRRGPALSTRLTILESASQAEIGGSRRSVETSATSYTATASYTSSTEEISSLSFSGTSSSGGGASRGSNCNNSNSSLDATPPPPPQPPSSLEAATCITAPPRSSRRTISSPSPSSSSARRPPPVQSSLLRTAAGGGAACQFKKSVSFSSSDDPNVTTTSTSTSRTTITAVKEIIHEIEPVSEMSHDEINDIWYSETDLDDMQEDVADVLYLLREKEQADDEAEANDDDQNDQKANDQKANDQEEETTTTIETRGLEGMRTPLERLHLRQYRERTWDAVLDEQDRQWDEIDANDGQDEWGEAVPGSMLLDPDRLGEVARESTRRCVEIALELARGDAEFVQRMVQEDMVRSARVAREERVRNRNAKDDGDGGGDEEGYASRSAPTLPVQGLDDDDEQDEGASAASSSFNVPPPPTSTMPGPPPSAAAARRARRQISAGETTCSSSSAPTLGAGEGPGLTGFVVRTKRRPSAQGQQGSGPSLGGGGGGGPGRRSRPMLNRAGPGRPPSEQVRRGSIGNSNSSGRPIGATNAAVSTSNNSKSRSKSTPSRPNRRNRNDSAVLQDLRSARQMERYGESRRILAMGGSFRSAAPTDDDSDPYLISEAGGIGGGRRGGGGSNNRTRRSPSTGRPASPRKIRKDKLKRGSTKPEYRKKYPNYNNGKDQQPLYTQPLSSDGTTISSSRQGGKQGMVKSLKAKMRRGHKKNGNYSSDDSLSLSEHDISERERLSAAANAMVSLIAEAADNDSEDRNGTYDFIPLQA